jgi:hypothetical protein
MKRAYCDGVDRRQMLRVGATGIFGGLTLPTLLEFQAKAATGKPAKAQSVIFLFLSGGPSTIDMWDLKPDQPKEIRGPYKPIATTVPGLQIGEGLPLCAKIANKYTLLRSHSHNDNGHTTGWHYTFTGYKADFADGTNSRVPNNVLYPSMGAIISRELGARGSVPAQINVPHPLGSGGPGFYGAEHAPFVIETDPVQPDFEVKDIRLPDGVSLGRHLRRRQALDKLEKLQGTPRGKAGTLSTYYQKAVDLMTSPAAKKAFDLKSEPEKVRETYGYSSLGQCSLLARRLVEAGCRFVGIDHGSWDTHFTQFPSLDKELFPHTDRAFSALVNDLDERGLLDSTLVIMMGEMGRTPRINNEAGRDHWSMAQTVVFAGGGMKAGAIIGATDKTASYPTADPVSVEDLLRTIYHQLGIDASKTYYTPLGRPVPIVNGGRVVRDLLA